MGKNNILVGADPELFVCDAEGKPVSAIGLVGGDKADPRRVEKGGLQEDNVLAEFNIDPASSEDEFVENIQTVVEILRGVLPHGIRIAEGLSSHEFDLQYLEEQGERAMVFGCDPDFDAYRMEVNPRPQGAGSGLRTAGGHIHLGYTDTDDFVSAARAARYCDLYLGVPSVLLDSDQRRRQLYGGPGAFRVKRYGMEYRTLSNFWIMQEGMIRWAYRNAVAAARAAMENENEDDELLFSPSEVVPAEVVRRAIGEGDRSLAEKIVNRCSIPMPE